MSLHIDTLIQAGESETVEFKAQWSEAVLEAVAALANTRGGTVLVGVGDDGQVLGLAVSEAQLRRHANQLADALRIQPSLEMLEVAGMRVLAIEVMPSRTPVSHKGRFYKRLGNTTREIAPDVLGQLFIERWDVKWDSVPGDFSLDEIDPEAVQRFVRLARRRLPQVSEEEPAESVLRKLDLLADGRPARGAVLLFGREPQRHFPVAQVHMGRFKDAITIVDDKPVRGNLFQQLDQVMQLFLQYLQVRYEIPGEIGDAASPAEAVRRREIWDYPLEALREATINALIHRDYFDSYGEISIRVYDDQVYIWSPGELPPGITVADLKKTPHDSRPRNPLLAQAFYFAGWIERWGSGTTRIVEMCRAQGLPDPEFRSESGRFEVQFFGDPYAENRLRDMGLSERQVQAVLLVKQWGEISIATLREAIPGVSDKTLYRDLQGLVERGVLRRVGEKKGSRYVLARGEDIGHAS